MASYGEKPPLQSGPSMEELKEFLEEDESPAARTLFVGNLDPKVDRQLLYELMIQVGPVESIKIVPAREGASKIFAFVVFEHACSVRYAMLAFIDVALFRAKLSLNYSGALKKYPRPLLPPAPPTFFEIPPGMGDLKGFLLAEKAIPPESYKSGYVLHDRNSLTRPAEDRGSNDYLPPAKRARYDENEMNEYAGSSNRWIHPPTPQNLTPPQNYQRSYSHDTYPPPPRAPPGYYDDRHRHPPPWAAEFPPRQDPYAHGLTHATFSNYGDHHRHGGPYSYPQENSHTHKDIHPQVPFDSHSPPERYDQPYGHFSPSPTHHQYDRGWPRR